MVDGDMGCLCLSDLSWNFNAVYIPLRCMSFCANSARLQAHARSAALRLLERKVMPPAIKHESRRPLQMTWAFLSNSDAGHCKTAVKRGRLVSLTIQFGGKSYAMSEPEANSAIKPKHER